MHILNKNVRYSLSYEICCHKFYQNVIGVDVASKTMIEKQCKKHCNMGVVVEEKK